MEIWKVKIKEWEESLKYSDPEKREIKSILRNVDFNGKSVLDVGCGIARLTIPISEYSKEVAAIDKDIKVINYCKDKKSRGNIKYILSDVLNFKGGGFDIAIFAQPDYDNFKEKLDAIYNLLLPKGTLIIIRWVDEGNEYNRLLDNFWNENKRLTKTVKGFSKNFLRDINNFFKIRNIYPIVTYDSYPTREKLRENIIHDSPIKFTKGRMRELDDLILRYNYKKIKIAMEMYICIKK